MISGVTIYAVNVGANLSPTGWGYTLHVFGEGLEGAAYALIDGDDVQVLHASPTKVTLGTNYKPAGGLELVLGKWPTTTLISFKIEWAKWVYPKRGPTGLTAPTTKPGGSAQPSGDSWFSGYRRRSGMGGSSESCGPGIG